MNRETESFIQWIEYDNDDRLSFLRAARRIQDLYFYDSSRAEASLARNLEAYFDECDERGNYVNHAFSVYARENINFRQVANHFIVSAPRVIAAKTRIDGVERVKTDARVITDCDGERLLF